MSLITFLGKLQAIFPLKLSPSSCNVPYSTGLVGSEAGLAKQMRTLVKLTSWRYTLFNVENLVLRARSALNGFAVKDGERLEVSVFSVQVSASMFLFPDT